MELVPNLATRSCGGAEVYPMAIHDKLVEVVLPPEIQYVQFPWDHNITQRQALQIYQSSILN